MLYPLRNCSIYADVFTSSRAQSLSPSDGAFFLEHQTSPCFAVAKKQLIGYLMPRVTGKVGTNQKESR